MMIGSSPEPDAAMDSPPAVQAGPVAAKHAAPQHGPRPLPLFLSMLRSETGGDRARMGRALEGLRRYQDASREAGPEAPPAVAEVLGATLRDYGSAGMPAVFVPSLINPPSILGLTEGNSLLRWLAAQG